MHTIQIISKNETLSLLDKFHTLESYMQITDQKLNESMRTLEQHIGQEIQTLQKAMVKSFEMIGEIIGTAGRGEKE